MEITTLVKSLKEVRKRYLDMSIPEQNIIGYGIIDKSNEILELQEMRTKYYKIIREIEAPRDDIDRLHIMSTHLFEDLLKNVLAGKQLTLEQIKQNMELLFGVQYCRRVSGVHNALADKFISNENTRLRCLLDKEIEKKEQSTHSVLNKK